MKIGRFILRVAAVLALVGAAVYAATAYWDTLVDVFYLAVGKIKEVKGKCFDACPICKPCKSEPDFAELDDYAD